MAHFDQRLTSIEAALAQVQRRLGLAPSSANWVDQVAGSLADIAEEDYQRFLEGCRAVRHRDSISAAAEPWTGSPKAISSITVQPPKKEASR